MFETGAIQLSINAKNYNEMIKHNELAFRTSSSVPFIQSIIFYLIYLATLMAIGYFVNAGKQIFKCLLRLFCKRFFLYFFYRCQYYCLYILLHLMKFKGIISHEGMRALERQFLPCLEKFGKQCFLLLTPTDVYLLQDVDTTDGMQISARLENVSKRIAARIRKQNLKLKNCDLIRIQNLHSFPLPFFYFTEHYF